MRPIDKETSDIFTFRTHQQLLHFKYQRCVKGYLRTIASIDESVGSLLACLDAEGLISDTNFIYTSGQGFFLGDNGWFDKRFM